MQSSKKGHVGNREQNKTLWTLCSVPFIMVLGNSMLIPVLPQIMETLDISLFHAGLLITAFSAPASVSILFAGYLADQYGRKVVLVPALGLYGLGGLIAGLAGWLMSSPYSVMLGARLLQGTGAGGTYQIAMVIVSDLYESQERSRALGLLESWNGVGKVVSPLAGSAAALLAWFAPFFVYSALCVPVALGVWWLTTEASYEKSHETLQGYLNTLRDILSEKAASYAVCLLAAFTILMLLFGVLSYTSDLLETRYGIGGLYRGAVIAVPVGAMAITSYVAGTILQRQLGRYLKPAVVLGCGLFAGSLLLANFLTAAWALLAILVFMGTAVGMVLPALNTLITSAAEEQHRGLTTAAYGTVRFGGVALGPPLFGILSEMGRSTLLLCTTATAAVAAALAAWLIRVDRMVPPHIRKSGS